MRIRTLASGILFSVIEITLAGRSPVSAADDSAATAAANKAIEAANTAIRAANTSTSDANTSIAAAKLAQQSATSAATSATQAATSATHAATSATEAATSAKQAATSAKEAATSAKQAATSATQAATSATEAATSAAQAAADRAASAVNADRAEAARMQTEAALAAFVVGAQQAMTPDAGVAIESPAATPAPQSATEYIQETKRRLEEIRKLKKEIDDLLNSVSVTDSGKVTALMAELNQAGRRQSDLEMALFRCQNPHLVDTGSVLPTAAVPASTAHLYILLPANDQSVTAMIVNGVTVRRQPGHIQHLELELRSSPTHCTVQLQSGAESLSEFMPRRFVAELGRDYIVDSRELLIVTGTASAQPKPLMVTQLVR